MEIITDNLKTIKDIPKKINYKNFPKDIDIRGEVYIGKRLLGGLGTRWYHVQPTNQIADAATSIDINNTQRMQQSLRVHAGEELILAINDGGTAWDASATQQVQIPYEVASGVTPAQNAASLRVWG